MEMLLDPTQLSDFLGTTLAPFHSNRFRGRWRCDFRTVGGVQYFPRRLHTRRRLRCRRWGVPPGLALCRTGIRAVLCRPGGLGSSSARRRPWDQSNRRGHRHQYSHARPHRLLGAADFRRRGNDHDFAGLLPDRHSPSRIDPGHRQRALQSRSAGLPHVPSGARHLVGHVPNPMGTEHPRNRRLPRGPPTRLASMSSSFAIAP